MYTGKFTFTPTNVAAMIDMAEFYMFQILKQEANKYLMTLKCDLQTALDMFGVAKRYDLGESKQRLYLFIQDYIEKILKFDHRIPIDDIIALMKLETSDKIFIAIYNWFTLRWYQELLLPEIDEVHEKMKNDFAQIIPHLKLTDFSSSFFNKLMSMIHYFRF